MSISNDAPSVDEVTCVASLGGGVIGQSWTALFLAAGKTVAVFDPDPTAEERIRQAVASAWPTLEQLGLATKDTSYNLEFHQSAESAVESADFVQESVPEVLEIKHNLYKVIEPHLKPHTIVASSASGLILTEMQTGWSNPGNFVLGHPFNPPHLIPLVEVMGNEQTAPGTVERARAFYESVGKVTIEVQREVPGHVANRLQAALWREAIHLINEGVATVEDVDTAVSAGPGIRWATMGPSQLFHLGAGEGGLAAFCERYTVSFNRWFDDLGQPKLDETTIQRLIEGIKYISDSRSISELSQQRDDLITNIVALARERRAHVSG